MGIRKVWGWWLCSLPWLLWWFHRCIHVSNLKIVHSKQCDFLSQLYLYRAIFKKWQRRGLGLAAWTQPQGVSTPQLAGRESGKKSAAAEEARDFFFPLCFLVREERGFREPPKRAPETGASRGDQRGHQRRAWDVKAAAAATKKPVCKHRSLSTPSLPGAGAARHCQGPVIRGQLSRENARCASGWCNVMQASAAAGSPCLLCTPPSPRPEWARAPEASAPLTPFCLGGEQMPSGDLHAEAGPNPKLNPRSCANREEKGKSLPAASEAAD